MPSNSLPSNSLLAPNIARTHEAPRITPSSQAKSPAGKTLQLPTFFKRIKLFRRKYRASLTDIQRQGGHCLTVPVPEYLTSDKDGESGLIIFEDSIPLPHPHAVHSEIEGLGAGRYSHWQGWLLFSTSDNSDPATNGRLYTVREV